MTMQDVTTYTEAVDAFILAAPWLDNADLPGVMALKSLGRHLDEATGLPPAALVSQFTMTFRDLRNREPKSPAGAGDALANALAAARQPDLFEAAAEAFHDDNGE